MDEAGEKLKRAFTGAFALLFAVICALLYSPKSNAWFSPRKAANDACMTPA